MTTSLAPFLSARPRPVSADLEGIERSAAELFRLTAGESPRRGRPMAARLSAAVNPARLLESRASNGIDAIPLPYQLWLAHLLWLEEVLNTLDCRPGEITAAELAGLAAVGRARARFLRDHVFCPHCGGANPRRTGARPVSGGASCRHCHREF